MTNSFSKLTAVALVVAALAGLAVLHTPATPAQEQPAVFKGVDGVVWQLPDDYPEGTHSDITGGFSRVYLKTHDGTDWMSTYDSHPSAVNGPQQFKALVDLYRSQGIEVVAWFVPKGVDVETQVAMAEMIIDTGVPLYADLEPFPGFCAELCGYLADAFWARLRAERPNADLGVIYDPRWFWRDASYTSAWLRSANAALPMCYWESFVDQPPWNDAGDCVTQSANDLPGLSGGRPMQYIPMLQGDTTGERFLEAVEAAKAVGSDRVSVWRRGVILNDVWPVISSLRNQTPAPTPAPPPAPTPAPTPAPAPLTLEALNPQCLERCLVREFSSPAVHVIDAGEKVEVLDSAEVRAIDPPQPIVVVPDDFLTTVPEAPNCRGGWAARMPSRWTPFHVCGGLDR
jgi:hypothetical protein